MTQTRRSTKRSDLPALARSLLRSTAEVWPWVALFVFLLGGAFKSFRHFVEFSLSALAGIALIVGLGKIVF